MHSFRLAIEQLVMLCITFWRIGVLSFGVGEREEVVAVGDCEGHSPYSLGCFFIGLAVDAQSNSSLIEVVEYLYCLCHDAHASSRLVVFVD